MRLGTRTWVLSSKCTYMYVRIYVCTYSGTWTVAAKLFWPGREQTHTCLDTETEITLNWGEGTVSRGGGWEESFGLGLVGLGWLPLVAFAAQLMLMCSKVFSAICFVAVRAIVTSGLNQFHAGKAPRALQPQIQMVSSTLCRMPSAIQENPE